MCRCVRARAPCCTTISQYSSPGYSWPVTHGSPWAMFSLGSPKGFPPASTQSEMLRAFKEWGKAANVKFTAGTDARTTQPMNVLFAAGAHGDPYPFDGPSGVLAHTFYPAPPNPEPIAGGHASGCGRTLAGRRQRPGPDAYRQSGRRDVSALPIPDPLGHWRCRRCPGHVWNARRFPGGAAAAPPSLPLLLTIQNSADTTTTSAPYISISGTTSGGSGPV